MLGQLKINGDGRIRDKVEMSVELLKKWEPPEGYFVAFSGGKDSQCVYHLCKMAGVKFDAHYARTSVDPPELIYFIRKHYPDVKEECQYYDDDKPEHHYSDGRPKPITMWSLIADNTMPPTRKARYCCKYLKETTGTFRYTVTGVRWAESTRRKINHDMVTILKTGKKQRKTLVENGVDYRETKNGGIVLNYDNDDGREVIQRCIRTSKMMINPIVHWEDEDVWEFLNGNGIPHCSLYDEGFTRIGCIGCPMGRQKKQEYEFDRWPKHREMYLKAFAKMLEAIEKRGIQTTDWTDPEAVMRWWLSEKEEED